MLTQSSCNINTVAKLPPLNTQTIKPIMQLQNKMEFTLIWLKSAILVPLLHSVKSAEESRVHRVNNILAKIH